MATLTLLVNGLTLALALGFLIIVLWQNYRSELNLFFAAFLFLVLMWNIGALLAQVVALTDAPEPLPTLSLSLLEVGFTGASVALYGLTAVLVRAYSRRMRRLAFATLLIVVVYRVLLLASGASTAFQALDSGYFIYRLEPLLFVFYALFSAVTLFMVWRFHRKIQSRLLRLGIVGFVMAQSLGFLNPALQAFSFSLTVSSLAALVISFAILRLEIIDPLQERVTQVESMHRVSLAITSQLSIDTVLTQIATQATSWLNADAAGIFLLHGELLELAAVRNLPESYVHHRLTIGVGMAGQVVQRRQSMYVNDYGREWMNAPDMPQARETFGAVICVPLIYGADVLGVLMVIAGRQGKLFRREDARLLEMLGAQAAVAIAHSRFFAEQGALTRAVEAARGQLETVLISTENPVIALDRRFRLVFANPAARVLFQISGEMQHRRITELVTAAALPTSLSAMRRDVRRSRVHVYEALVGERVFLVHLAVMAHNEGWVAVLNDITQLKELDRLKSLMFRMNTHELKNPLQVAFLYLDQLREDLSSAPDADLQMYIDKIEINLERMKRTITGIIDLERIKSGMLTMEQCSPVRIVRSVIEDMHSFADAQNIELTEQISDDLPNFTGDFEQVQRALINLVENAVKFTPEGGRVTVSAEADAETIAFRVHDTGIGIEDALQSQVFERFFRGRQKGSEHVSGTGLGLSLVKAVAETHHGSVTLTSEVGVGSTFTLRLPLVLHAAPNAPKREFA